ncbi:MAG: ClbS/DfsB family four-helix bundle protein [Anaerolineales bacterium]|nr:ClbS/DfsB family four-helix bundle protein [Anaerolineales bacterium]
MTKAKLLELIQTERQALEAVLAKLDEEQMIAPLLEAAWSVKDTLAHIVAWEQHMTQWTKASLQDEPTDPPPYDLPDAELDAINMRIFVENKDRPLADVQKEFTASYQEVLKLVQTLTEEDLLDPECLAWREGHPLWELVGANTFWHYAEHRAAIEKLLAA